MPLPMSLGFFARLVPPMTGEGRLGLKDISTGTESCPWKTPGKRSKPAEDTTVGRGLTALQALCYPVTEGADRRVPRGAGLECAHCEEETSRSVCNPGRLLFTREKSDRSGNHECLIGFPSVDSLQHLPKLTSLFFPGTKDAVGTIRIVPSGAPDQATSSPPGKEPALLLMLNDFHADLAVNQR